MQIETIIEPIKKLIRYHRYNITYQINSNNKMYNFISKNVPVYNYNEKIRDFVGLAYF